MLPVCKNMKHYDDKGDGRIACSLLRCEELYVCVEFTCLQISRCQLWRTCLPKIHMLASYKDCRSQLWGDVCLCEMHIVTKIINLSCKEMFAYERVWVYQSNLFCFFLWEMFWDRVCACWLKCCNSFLNYVFYPPLPSVFFSWIFAWYLI